MSESNQTAPATGNELFLPDGKPTNPQPGDVFVWEKDTGVLYVQRPGIGKMRATAFEGTTLPTDEASVKELEGYIREDFGWVLGAANIRLIDESSDRAIFEIIKQESGF